MQYKRFDFDQVTSTLDVAAEEAYTHGAVIVAQSQSAGRGQRGNKWISTRGENLTFSLVISPAHIEVCQQFVVSMMASLGVVGALGKLGAKAQIKWPNDIYVGDRKICGILIEHSFSSQYLAKSILGIGINVGQTRFDPQLPNPVSLAVLGLEAGVEDTLTAFCDSFAGLYELSSDELATLYMSKLYRGDGFYAYRDKGGEFSAKIAAIDKFLGTLTLEKFDGTMQNYAFKEVEYIL